MFDIEVSPWTGNHTSGITIFVNSRFTGLDDGPTAGVREPRRPLPNLPTLAGACEIELQENLTFS